MHRGCLIGYRAQGPKLQSFQIRKQKRFIAGFMLSTLYDTALHTELMVLAVLGRLKKTKGPFESTAGPCGLPLI